MALDPNIPLRMPQQPSFGEQAGQAFELASVVEKQRAMQQQRQDSAWLQEQMKSGADIQTPEGLKKLTEAARGKVSMPTYQTLIKTGQEMQERDLKIKQSIAQTDLAKLETGMKKNEAMLNYGAEAMSQWEKDKEKFGEQVADENFKAKYLPNSIQSAAQSGMFSPEELQSAAQLDRPTLQSKLKFSEHFQKLATEGVTQKKNEQAMAIAAAEEERNKKLFPLTMRKTAAQASESEAKAQEARMGGGASAKALQARYGKPPKDYRWTETGELERIPGSAADTKFKLGMQADQTAVTGVEAAMDRLANAATELRDAPGLEGIAGIKGAIPDLFGSPAANAEALRRSLVAQVGFSVLQDMRNASKTGGALGNVSDAEGKRLEAALGNLERGGQSLKQLKNNIDKVIFYAVGAKQRMKSAFEKKYAEENIGPAEQATAQTAAPSSDVLSILKKHGVK